MKKEDFHKGQTVWVYLIGNAARGRKTTEERIREWEVTKVGRKYITAKDKSLYWEAKFDIENNFRHVYDIGTSDYALFLNKEEIYKMINKAEMISYIEDCCRPFGKRSLYKMSDDDLITISDVFKKYE